MSGLENEPVSVGPEEISWFEFMEAIPQYVGHGHRS